MSLHNFKTIPKINDGQKNTIDFIGIGAPKCASSWVAECLQEHPDILFPGQKSKWALPIRKHKELRFFNTGYGDDWEKCNLSNYKKGLDWYLGQFPSYQEGKIRGEFCVYYLTDEKALERIKNHFPNVKILTVLRNPVDMIYSLYCFRKASVETKVPKDLSEAVKKGLYKDLCLDKGLYYKHLKKYFDTFPKKDIHVMIFDDIKNKPEETFKNLYRFLNVRDDFIPSILYKKIEPSIKTRFNFLRDLGYYPIFFLKKLGLKKIASWITWNESLYRLYYRVNVVIQKYPPIEPKIRAKLKEYFKEDIEKLEKLIARDLSVWQ